MPAVLYQLIFALLLLLAFVPLSVGGALLPCTLKNAIERTPNATINPTCSKIVFENVTWISSVAPLANPSFPPLTIKIPINQMALNTNVAHVSVIFDNCVMSGKVLLLFDGKGSRGLDISPSISISVTNLVGENAGILFLGDFPPRTSILVKNARMKADGQNGTTFPGYDTRNAGLLQPVKLIGLVNVSLRQQSSFVIDNCTLNITTPLREFNLAGGIAVWIFGGFLDTEVRDTDCQLEHVEEPFAVSGGSSFRILRSKLIAPSGRRDNFNRAIWSYLMVVFRDNSSWSIVDTHIDGNFRTYCGFRFESGSRFEMINSQITGRSLRGPNKTLGDSGFDLSKRLEIFSGSSVHLESCQMEGSMGFGVNSHVLVADFSAFRVINSTFFGDDFNAFIFDDHVNISNHSLVSFMGSSFTCRSVTCISTLGLTHLHTTDSSSFTVETSTINCETTVFAKPCFAFGVKWSLKTLRNSSFLLNNSGLTGYGVGFVVLDNIETIDHSTFDIRNSSLESTFFAGTAFGMGNVTPDALEATREKMFVVQSHSIARIHRSTFIKGIAGFFRMLIDDMSMYVVSESNLTGLAKPSLLPYKPFQFGYSIPGGVTTTRGSAWVMTNVAIDFSAFFGNITTTNFSSWSMRGVRLGPMVNSFEVDGVWTQRFSSFVIEQSKTGWISLGPVLCRDNSWVKVTTTRLLSQEIEEACCIVTSSVALQLFSGIGILDNNCTKAPKASGDVFMFIIGDQELKLFTNSVFYNRANNILSADGRAAAPSNGMPDGATSIKSNMCTPSVDCFVPFVSTRTQSSATLVRCVQGDPSSNMCACIPGCGEGPACTARKPNGTVGSGAAGCSAKGEQMPLRKVIPDTVTRSLSHTSDGETATESQSKRLIPKVRPSAPSSSVATACVALSGVSSTSAGAVQRAQTIFKLALCDPALSDPLALFESPTRLFIGPDANGYNRGAVVGTVILFCGLCVAAAVVPFAVRKPDGCSYWQRVGKLSAPGILLVPYSMLSVPTMTASVSLLVNNAASGDTAIGAVGVVACALPCIFTLLMTTLRFGSCADKLHSTASSFNANIVLKCVAIMFGREIDWVDSNMPGAGGSSDDFTSHYGSFFDPYTFQRQWFVFLELLVGLLVAVYGGALLDDNCKSLLWASLGTTTVFLVATVLLRPFCTRVDFALAVVNAVLNVAASGVGLAKANGEVLTDLQMYVNLFGIACLVVNLIYEGFFTKCFLYAMGLLALGPLREAPRAEATTKRRVEAKQVVERQRQLRRQRMAVISPPSADVLTAMDAALGTVRQVVPTPAASLLKLVAFVCALRHAEIERGAAAERATTI